MVSRMFKGEIFVLLKEHWTLFKSVWVVKFLTLFSDVFKDTDTHFLHEILRLKGKMKYVRGWKCRKILVFSTSWIICVKLQCPPSFTPVKNPSLFEGKSPRINEVTYLAIDHFWKEAFELKNQEIIVVHLRPHLTQELIRKWFVNKRYIPWHLPTAVRDIFLRFQKRSLFLSSDHCVVCILGIPGTLFNVIKLFSKNYH